ncbi:unnamed protein product, partial [Pylaiella littoralis]
RSFQQQPPRYLWYTRCSLAMSSTLPKNSLTESSPFMKLHVLRGATTPSFLYAPAFFMRSTPEYPLYVKSPQYQHAVRTMLLYSSKLIDTSIFRLLACSWITR